MVRDSGSPDLVCKKLKALAPTQLEPNLICWLVCSSVSKFDFLLIIMILIYCMLAVWLKSVGFGLYYKKL